MPVVFYLGPFFLIVFLAAKWEKSAGQHENHMLVVGHEIESVVFHKGNF